MSVVANLTAMLTANTSNFEAGMKRANRQAKESQSVFVSLGQTLKNNLGFLSGTALVNSFKNTVNSMDDMVKAADRIGISVESLSKMAYVGKLADVSMEDLEKSIRKMQVALIDTPKSFEQIGLSAQTLVNLNPDEAFAQILDSLMKIENPALRAAAAVDIFGKAGTKMINFASGGADSIKQLYEEAKKLGVVFDNDTARAAERLNDNITRMQAAIQGVFIEMAKTGSLDAMADSLDLLLQSIIWVTDAYGDMLRAFGADFNGADTVQRTIDETTKAIEHQQRVLATATTLNQYFDRSESIGKAKGELERLNTVLENSKKTLDTINTPKDKNSTSKPAQVDLDKITSKTQKLSDTERELKRIYEETRTPLERYNSEVERLNELRKELGEDTYNRAIEKAGAEYEKATDKAEDLNDMGKDLGLTFNSAFEDAIVGGKELSEVMRGLANDILRIVARKAITEPIGNAISSGIGDMLKGGGSGGGLFDGIFSGLGFASGGNPPVGKFSMVGEDGPELFMPKTSGTIIPNDALGGGSNIYNIDARGTDASVVRRLEQSLMAMAGPGVVEQRVADAQARGAI